MEQKADRDDPEASQKAAAATDREPTAPTTRETERRAKSRSDSSTSTAVPAAR
jgi:hypothetical protein